MTSNDPEMPDLSEWQVRWFYVGGLRKVIARRTGITLVYVEHTAWTETKLRGGRVIDERSLDCTPENLQRVFENQEPV